MAAVYRLRQGIRSLLAFSQTVDLALAAQYLTPDLLTLFQQMRRSEQLHSLNVLRQLLEESTITHDLVVAALLHDVGKSRYPLWTWQKTLAVLTRATAPRLFKRWSKGSPDHPWMRPFVASVQHPAWGAAMVREAGASETAIWLVAEHQTPAQKWDAHPCVALLRRLQQADDSN